MAVSEELRKVERPKNTICKIIGKKCAVIERIGCKRVNGKNIPINGKVVGHIIDGKYVPKEHGNVFDISMKNYGDIILANELGKSLYEELKLVYTEKDAEKIYLVALLRAICPSLKDYKIKEAYECSFASEMFHSVQLGKNSISSLIESIGKDYAKCLTFMQNRVKKIDEKNTIAIDGMLKSNNSKINSLSNFSYKGRVKSCKDISLVTAFDVTTKEIICSIPYSGNTVDWRSFPDFIEKTGISKGLIIGDKGTSDGKKLQKGIGFIFPLKRNKKIIAELKMYDMSKKLNLKDKAIMCKKAKNGNYYYYSFLDVQKASKEKSDYIKRNNNLEKLKTKEKSMGTIVFISDQDLTCDEIYSLYQDRWEIELVHRFYKDVLEIDTTREHSDYSVYGSEFLNLLSAIIGNRMKIKFSDCGLLEKYTYGDILKILKKYKKIKLNGSEWQNIRMTATEDKILTSLGI